MLRIRDDLFMGLVIGGRDYPLEATGFTSMKIVSTRDTSVPMLEFRVVDSLNFFTSKVTLADGVQLQVLVGTSKEEFATYNFRVYGFTEVKVNGASQYTIIGYLDVPLYFLATANAALTGSSSSVLKQIAGLAGMGFSGTPTSDSQVWLPINARYCQWAREIAAHGYASDQSFMTLGVTPDKVLIYRDVMAMNLSQSMAAFTNTEPQVKKQVYQMTDNRSFTRSGTNNAAGGGYGHLLVNQVAGAQLQSTKSKVGFRRFSPFLEVNKDVKAVVQGAAGSPGVQHVEFTPINCGNTHSRYWEARYQNQRIGRLFSMGATWMTEARTGIDILQPVRYMPSTAPGSTGSSGKEQAQGVYVVTAKSIVAQMGNYFERFEAYSFGSNTDPAQSASQE